MKFINTRNIAAASVASLGLLVGGIAFANASAVKPDCKTLSYPLCPRSVAAGQVVDNSIPATKITPADRAKFLKDDNTPDVKGDITVNKTFNPTTVEKIGGRFADNATLVGEVTIPAGTSKVDADGFWTTLAAGPAGTRPQLALRGDGVSVTIFPGEASPAKDRELTGHATQVVTLDAATVVKVYAFGYNDDTSAAGAGRLQVTASVVATRG